jgi:[ribosomal protein S18]-alanine N-acetyltransferase
VNEPGSAVEILFRRMREEDVEQVYAIDTLSFSLPWSERSYRFEVSNPNSRPWVAEAVYANGARRIVGILVLWIILDEGHIATIAVHPDFRRQHIARRMLAIVLIAAIEEGISKAYLEVRRGNLGAQAMYEQFGFHVEGVRLRYYVDNQEDALLMTQDHLVKSDLLNFMA